MFLKLPTAYNVRKGVSLSKVVSYIQLLLINKD